ncbi:phospholipase D family protein [Desulfosporosinus sp. PR]|uniref:phospholipase D family protein n=1 Tax=Candidatus Desulfosporosinus nitrosoreducens TaxID=3401928 RepID=UPI0027FC15D1|nr:phospholipase D family protein [Desulfosporosinus sp. PR]MDQ7094284.1 phospholipase D family protein [Desulfosporosinus sp. PR]
MKKIIIPLLFISLALAGCSASTPIANASPNQATSTIAATSPTTEQTASTTSNDKIEYYFTRAHQHPEQALESQISSAKSTLDIAIYSLTKKDIVDSIIAAKKRGVDVRIITDHIESKTKSEASELPLLKSAGIPLKEDTHSGLMHMKVSIIDKSVVTTGSYNYTQNASTDNDEVLVIIHDAKIASDWTNEFEQMWEDTKDYAEIK